MDKAAPPPPPQKPTPPPFPPQQEQQEQLAWQQKKQLALKTKLLEKHPTIGTLKEGTLIEALSTPDGKCVVIFGAGDKWFCGCCTKSNSKYFTHSFYQGTHAPG